MAYQNWSIKEISSTGCPTKKFTGVLFFFSITIICSSDNIPINYVLTVAQPCLKSFRVKFYEGPARELALLGKLLLLAHAITPAKTASCSAATSLSAGQDGDIYIAECA